MSVAACIFPGQGSQEIGMGKAFYDAFPCAKEVFQEVDDALDQHLSALMFDGDPDELTLTANAQPAIMATSIAIFNVLQQEAGFDLTSSAAYVAGHSLGEYSALCAAGALSVRDTARLLKRRGQAMQEAVPTGQGIMAAILGVEMEKLEDILASVRGDAVCEIANDNAPGQVVISGEKAAVEAAMLAAKEAGAKRALALNVSAPFHSSLIRSAADAMQEALSHTTLNIPSVPLVANVTAQSTNDPEEIKDLLVQQVTGRVRWTESIQWMVGQQVNTTIEIGHGKVLSGLNRRIHKELESINISAPEHIDGFVKAA